MKYNIHHTDKDYWYARFELCEQSKDIISYDVRNVKVWYCLETQKEPPKTIIKWDFRSTSFCIDQYTWHRFRTIDRLNNIVKIYD